MSKKLWEHPHWHKLLHYKRTWTGHYKSDIDGGYFFLAENGKRSPRDELLATLSALLSGKSLSTAQKEEEDMHPLCKFRARLRFLREHLDLREEDLPDVDCGRWDSWQSALNIDGASLIFASSYMNNPASMFGHTLLRLESSQNTGRRTVLNYGVNYAAQMPPDNDFSFVIKGLTGMYSGNYSMLPYYLLLKMYSQMESRDMWEYKLDLDTNQLNYLIEHLWELGSVRMDYFFLTENCSYNLLTLLEGAVPGRNLDFDDAFAVIPAATVKAVAASPGLVLEKKYRPSLITVFRSRVDMMDRIERTFLRRILRSPSADTRRIMEQADSALTEERRTLVYDAAIDFIARKKGKAKGGKKAEFSEIHRQLLVHRSKLSISVMPVDTLRMLRNIQSPEFSHDWMRAGFRGGFNENEYFGQLDYRFSFHDWNASEAGLLNGSEIEFMEMGLQYASSRSNPEEDAIRLDHLKVLEIQSLTPWHSLLRPISWRFETGYINLEGARKESVSYVELGGGLALRLYSPGFLKPVLYAMGQWTIRSSRWNMNAVESGPSLKSGLRIPFGPRFSLLNEALLFMPLFGDNAIYTQFNSEFRISLTRDQDLRAGYAYREGENKTHAALNFYF